jgi:type II secretion system protein H
LRAFTLIELILVMTILLVVMAVAFPSLRGFFRGRNLDSEARRILALTRYGQSRAVAEGVPVVLWIDSKQRTYGLEAAAGRFDFRIGELGSPVR